MIYPIMNATASYIMHTSCNSSVIITVITVITEGHPVEPDLPVQA